jgi:hypothetical protein
VIERNSTGFTVKCENYCPVGYSDGCCKTIAACETVIERNSTDFTVKCENYIYCLTTSVRVLDGTIILTFNSKTGRVSFNHCFTGSNCLTTAAVVDRNSTGFTVKCENYCPVECSDAVVRQLLPVKQWLKETRRVLLLNVRIIVPSGTLTAVVRQLLPVKQWLKETRGVLAIVLQQPQSTRRDNNSHI